MNANVVNPSFTGPRPAPDVLSWIAPVALALALLTVWEATVRVKEIPPYLLASPSGIGRTLVEQRSTLAAAWWVTFQTMAAALAAAVASGSVLAGVFASSRLVEASLFPYAVTLQVTPLVAVAPFIVLWVGLDRLWLTQVLCAWIVAFFPILSNTTVGLRSVEPSQRDLFDLYGASRWQRMRWLLAPSALPYFLAGVRISANLALVGAVVAEFVIGQDVERPGLASTILASQHRLDTPLMFAALAVISLTGVATYLATHLMTRALLGEWHASEMQTRE